MQCPRHEVQFAASAVRGCEIDQCPACTGLWIPGRSVDSLLGEGELLKLRSLCSARLSSLACPHDGSLLGEATIARVTLDLCPVCHGLWLDPGEFERLRNRAVLPQESRIAGSRLVTGPEGASGIEIIIEVLFGLVHLL